MIRITQCTICHQEIPKHLTLREHLEKQHSIQELATKIEQIEFAMADAKQALL